MSTLALRDITLADAARAGQKAASLGDLLRAGVRVPPGFVVLADAFAAGKLVDAARADVAEAARELGAATFAVRSSASTEDLVGSSSAGRYLTLLGVRADELEHALARVHASREAGVEMAVLVQPMLAASAAGVAFTADPLTGDRDVVTVTAVRGLGDRVVGGEAIAEEWQARGDRLARLRAADVPVLVDLDARAVVTTALAIAERRGAPQDIEWAIVNGDVHVLQARPMTGQPEPVRWAGPPGAFARSLRLGEWIGDPVTPLFESWLLTTMERTMHEDFERLVGQPAPRPLHVVVNGWYYYSLNFLPASPAAILRMLPGIVRRLPRNGRRVAPVFPPLARFGIDLYAREWRNDLLPAYRDATAAAASALDRTPPSSLPGLIAELAERAGHYFTSVTFVAGYGWKTEIPLARFYRRHLQALVGGDYRQLLRGLTAPRAGAHAVQSLDWWFPTLGEIAHEDRDPGGAHARAVAERELVERRCRDVLGGKQRDRFDRVVTEAQRGAVLREEQLADLTLPWPFFRAALRRLGALLVARGAIASPDDIHFLYRAELDAALTDGNARFASAVAPRRATWRRQRRLLAPLVIGTIPRMLASLLQVADQAMRDPIDAPGHAIRGIPVSAGRATGRARLVWDAGDFARVRQGDVVVCRVMTPASSALFGMAAAVVADVGSPAAHASVIAREFGIPAVVGTQDATARIADGALVTVDGGAGVVWLVDG